VADIETIVNLIPGHCFGLRSERHSRDTALEVVKRHLERQRDLIDQQLAVIEAGGGQAAIFRGSKEYPLKTFSPTGCRWDGVEPDEHGERYTTWVGMHDWETPTAEQVKARTEVVVDCADVELDDGENLKDLGEGNYLELAKPTAGMHPGIWVLTAYEDDDKARMRRMTAEEIQAARRAEANAQIYA
jgi:hypothetical protein